MANEVKIKVSADASGTVPVIEGVTEGFEDMETEADKAGNALKDVDRELEIMDRKVTASRLELKRLAHEFANVDDEAQKIDISKAMDKLERDISQSLRAQKALKFSDLIPNEPDPPAISKFSAGLGKMSAAAAANVGPVLGSSIGIAAAPLLASTLAGGIIGGIGLGGMVGGIAVAARDPRVTGEFNTLKSTLGDRLKEGAGAFVPATLQGIGIIKKSLDTIDFEQIFSSTSKFVVPLAKNIGNALESLGDGIEDVTANAGPAVAAIGDGIENIGESIGRGLSSLADNGETAAESLDNVMTAVGHVTDATFGFVNATMEAQEFLDKFAGGVFAFDAGLRALNGVFDDGAGTMGRYVAGAEGAEDGLGGVRDAQEETTVTSAALAAALKEVDDALRKQVDPVFKLLDAQSDLKDSQEAVTKATKEHGKGSREADEALRDLTLKALDLESAVKGLGGTFDGKMTPALRQTLRQAGLTEGQIDDLGDQFDTARRQGEKFNRNYVAKLRVDGYPTVYKRLFTVKDVLNDIPRAVNIAMKITGVSSASAAAAAIRKNAGYAHGGIVGAAANGATSNGLTLVGENGPELAEVKPGGRVWSNPDTQRMLSGQGGRQQPITVNLVVDGKVLAQATVEPTRSMITRQAGGNAQQFWGQGS